MFTLYPPIKPSQTSLLMVDEPHVLYVEECGNPNGLPVIFLHGGPGGGCTETHRRFFDPLVYRIILFDQRGCGRSTPHRELSKNNTQALISDIEKIRTHFNIDRWIVFGGSWGSTLGLVYAETHPDRVLGLILRGIFLNRPIDLQWLVSDTGIGRIFPDHWESFISIIPEDQRHNPLLAYHEMLMGEDEITRMAAAKAWIGMAARTATLEPNKRLIEEMEDPHHALSGATIEVHYFMNNCFLEANQILRNIDAILNIPCIIVHGRYDMICTLDNAWELHQAWPNSELCMVRNAGHSANEPGVVDALVRATQKFGAELS